MFAMVILYHGVLWVVSLGAWSCFLLFVHVFLMCPMLFPHEVLAISCYTGTYLLPVVVLVLVPLESFVTLCDVRLTFCMYICCVSSCTDYEIALVPHTMVPHIQC